MTASLDASVRLPLTDLDDAAQVAAQRLRLVAAAPELDGIVTVTAAQRLERAVEADRQRRAEQMLAGCGGDVGFGAFHNRLRILLSIDRHELVEAGVLDTQDLLGWSQFQHDPFRAFLRLDTRRASALWGLVQSRETR
ncbi:MAG: hypothetical protein J0I54_20510 [Bosea sp.]|mgnify:CR=1 FL=1|uniref:hypothetical protein n=1 Tax=unclassified Bosea (in: a-proteobacteria) TaxID=2653178 RepID=UPI00095A4744|nr:MULTISPECIES: hypothetical protein [unclassified Bosea (in: a-proteobacteria)]MBN9459022.1 hypothetical protein [Bosea sp. (in: a-proteobacteria)]OJV06235.1 MAG: hypothetical protein BGO20_08235 [Bosea sp. 67-29]